MGIRSLRSIPRVLLPGRDDPDLCHTECLSDAPELFCFVFLCIVLVVQESRLLGEAVIFGGQPKRLHLLQFRQVVFPHARVGFQPLCNKIHTVRAVDISTAENDEHDRDNRNDDATDQLADGRRASPGV